MLSEIEREAKLKMAKAVKALEHDLATLRTGRASTALLDGVLVDAYGSPSPIQQLATVSTPDGKTILIQPWDKGVVAPIEKAILAANLGFTPNSDGRVIRINIPALTEERRKELVKTAHGITEKSRVVVRGVRRHCNDELKKAEKTHGISEDERDALLEKVQKLTDERVKEIGKILEAKETEILEI